MTEDPVKLVPTRPEAEIAAELKAKAKEALAAVTALMDEAVAQGLLIQFDGIQRQPPYYKHEVLNLRVAKHF